MWLYLKISKQVISGGDIPYKGYISPMVDLTDWIVRPSNLENEVIPKYSFMGSYVEKVFKSENIHGTTQRMCTILDTKYEKPDWNKAIKYQYQNLTEDKQKDLLNTMLNIKDVFDDTLDMCNNSPVCVQLKIDTKPAWLRPCPVIRKPEAMLII